MASSLAPVSGPPKSRLSVLWPQAFRASWGHRAGLWIPAWDAQEWTVPALRQPLPLPGTERLTELWTLAFRQSLQSLELPHIAAGAEEPRCLLTHLFISCPCPWGGFSWARQGVGVLEGASAAKGIIRRADDLSSPARPSWDSPLDSKLTELVPISVSA